MGGGATGRAGVGTPEGESWRGGGMCTERPPPVRVALTERKAFVVSAAKTSLTNCTVSGSEVRSTLSTTRSAEARTLSQKVVELIDAQLQHVLAALLVAEQGKHVIGQNVRVGVGS